MTIFAKKTMNVSEWAKVQDQIGALQIAMGAPHDLMMLSTNNANDRSDQDIYIGLPDQMLLAAFPGSFRSSAHPYRTFSPLSSPAKTALRSASLRFSRNAVAGFDSRERIRPPPRLWLTRERGTEAPRPIPINTSTHSNGWTGGAVEAVVVDGRAGAAA